MYYQSKPKYSLTYFSQIMITLVMILTFNQSIYAQIKADSTKSKAIKEILDEIISYGEAPGIIAAIASSEGINAIASAGIRKYKSDIPFTINDYVHLGSCTKAMTSTMIATLVAEGKLSWETTLLDAIPNLKDKIHANHHQITLWQLLIHRAGIFYNAYDWGEFEDLEIKDSRLALLVENLDRPSSYTIGEYYYSNLGYMVAACMAEQVTGQSWESLMNERIFQPLGMKTAGFGAPNTPNQIDQPWGHKRTWDNSGWSVDQTDNPDALGPAGMIHCSIEDWAKFLALQIKDTNPILDKKYLNKLIEAVDFYAGGWGVAEHDWAKGIVLSHTGSNGIWYTSVIVAPMLNRSYMVVTNSRDFGITEDMCQEVMGRMINIDFKQK